MCAGGYGVPVSSDRGLELESARARVRLALDPGLSGDLVRDVERGVVGLFVILRVSNLVTIALGTPTAVGTARDLTVFVVVTAIVVAFIVAECVALWRSGRFAARPWGWGDFVLALAGLALVSPLFAPHEQTGTWAVWAPGFAVGAAAGVGIWARGARRVLVLSSVLGSAYFATMLAWSDQSVWTIAANVATYPAFGLIACWAASYLRLLAGEAVKAREAAITATARLELERYRLLVHDATGILRLLGDEETPEVMHRALRSQALAESTRLRAYLSDGAGGLPGTPTDESGWTLGRTVADAARGFEDLPIDLVADLGAHAVLGEASSLVLQRAVVTVLHNVRRHAHANRVVVHADAHEGSWELSVRDDGVGFSPDDHPAGFGLSTQVEAEVTRRGMAVAVHSVPGEGTSVTFTGRALDMTTPRERG